MIEDYLRGRDNTLPCYDKAIDGFVADRGDRAIPLAVFGVRRKYLEVSFSEMQKNYCTIEDYFARASLQGFGAGRGTRTLMVSPPADFESAASTDSAIPAG
jgi:hypothetical protein